MRRPRLLLLAGAVAVAGCSSAVAPFATVPKAAPTGVVDPRPRVAICYNTLKSTAAQVQEAAQAECLNGGTAERVDTDYRTDFCPLLTPGRATFACQPK